MVELGGFEDVSELRELNLLNREPPKLCIFREPKVLFELEAIELDKLEEILDPREREVIELERIKVIPALEEIEVSLNRETAELQVLEEFEGLLEQEVIELEIFEEVSKLGDLEEPKEVNGMLD